MYDGEYLRFEYYGISLVVQDGSLKVDTFLFDSFPFKYRNKDVLGLVAYVDNCPWTMIVRGQLSVY